MGPGERLRYCRQTCLLDIKGETVACVRGVCGHLDGG